MRALAQLIHCPPFRNDTKSCSCSFAFCSELSTYIGLFGNGVTWAYNIAITLSGFSGKIAGCSIALQVSAGVDSARTSVDRLQRVSRLDIYRPPAAYHPSRLVDLILLGVG